MLSALLTNGAREVLRHLQPAQLNDFAALDSALQRRFGMTTNVNYCKALLRSLKLKPGQPLEHFSIEVEDAMRGAFPGYPEHLLQLQMVGAFIEGLTDHTMALFLTKENHSTLDSALRSARVQPPQMVERPQRAHRAHAVSVEEECTAHAPEQPDRRAHEAMVNAVNAMTETVHSLSVQQNKLLEREQERERAKRSERESRRDRTPERSSDRRRESSRDERPRQNWWKNAECFYCKKKGHIKRNRYKWLATCKNEEETGGRGKGEGKRERKN